MTRKAADCRDVPGSSCSLTISGEEADVLAAAVQHALQSHGHEDTAELHDWLRANLKDEGAGAA